MEDDALISKHINSPSFILPLPALNCHAVSWVKHTSNLFIWSPRLWPTRVHRFQKFVLVVINWLFRFVLIDFSESFPLLLFSDQGLTLICSNMFWHLKQLGIEPASPHSLDNLLYLHSHLQQQNLAVFSNKCQEYQEKQSTPTHIFKLFCFGLPNVLSSYRGDHNIICSHHVEYNVLDEKTKHLLD